MAAQKQMTIPATYMRGGTSKGVFFNLKDLPEAAQVAGHARDQILLRVIGSPDPYAKQIDGMGGATSSTSKTVIVTKSQKPEHDVDYLFGQIAIDQPFVDWTGNCGNLSAAVGPYAIHQGLVDASRIPENGVCTVRIWQVNIQQTIIAHVPIVDGRVQELGDFELDGVTFPAAEIPLAFCEEVDPEATTGIFPTGKLKEQLDVPDIGSFEVTMIQAGIPTVFLHAEDLGYTGTELQEAINSDPQALVKLEKIRAYASLKMGLISDLAEAVTRQHTPKIAFAAPAQSYVSSSGKAVDASQIDLVVRAMSMGKLHHAMMGTAAIAIAAAACVPGTIVYEKRSSKTGNKVCFGHPSGTLTVGAEMVEHNGVWQMQQAIMSRSARILMKGEVYLPENTF
ncbi:2-methylaconitate cis-trans isomerase PrpF [Acinetobacter sp. MB5]|uniref:2-methylaconitate cis-trans isomerase PrpF n=1 Tax=Acinetobacter sp. MB5 TaxID=2069438 RepID=UPI000DD04270|nr:2-methylaconitate cis-trans isomerase PrpF [Acinetobacter sp. MB5]